MAKIAPNIANLDEEAFSLAETGFLKKGFKSGTANFTSAQHIALKSYVEARLLVKHPGTSIAVLQHAAEYGVDQAFATQGQQVYDIHGNLLSDVGGAIVGAAEAPIKTAEALSNFFGVLTDPTTWLRGLYIVGGGTLILSGVFIVAKELGAPAPTPPIFHAKKLLRKAG